MKMMIEALKKRRNLWLLRKRNHLCYSSYPSNIYGRMQISSSWNECNGFEARCINMDVDVVVTNLKSRVRMIDTSEEIAQNIVFDAPTQSLNLEKVDTFVMGGKAY
ncbi:uncharacterized protein [Medicago truncatula]|nr:uncharacterized protein LOC112422598 [Medicago truncatula]